MKCRTLNTFAYLERFFFAYQVTSTVLFILVCTVSVRGNPVYAGTSNRFTSSFCDFGKRANRFTKN